MSSPINGSPYSAQPHFESDRVERPKSPQESLIWRVFKRVIDLLAPQDPPPNRPPSNVQSARALFEQLHLDDLSDEEDESGSSSPASAHTPPTYLSSRHMVGELLAFKDTPEPILNEPPTPSLALLNEIQNPKWFTPLSEDAIKALLQQKGDGSFAVLETPNPSEFIVREYSDDLFITTPFTIRGDLLLTEDGHESLSMNGLFLSLGLHPDDGFNSQLVQFRNTLTEFERETLAKPTRN